MANFKFEVNELKKSGEIYNSTTFETMQEAITFYNTITDKDKELLQKIEEENYFETIYSYVAEDESGTKIITPLEEEKEYTINVDLKFINLVTAENKEKAIEIIKNNFMETYNLELKDKEIVFDEDRNIYNSTYDYEDIKIAICIQEFFDNHKNEIKGQCYFECFENMITLAQEIKNNWLIDSSMNNLSEEEYAYIQKYAQRYLKEKYLF